MAGSAPHARARTRRRHSGPPVLAAKTQLELAGEDPQKALPDVAHHLRICPECKEEHDALLKILQSED